MNHYPIPGRSLEIKEKAEEPLYSQLSQKVACFLQKFGSHSLNSSSRFTFKQHLNYGKQNYGRRGRRIMSLLQLKGAAKEACFTKPCETWGFCPPKLIKLRKSINATENWYATAPSHIIKKPSNINSYLYCPFPLEIPVDCQASCSFDSGWRGNGGDEVIQP